MHDFKLIVTRELRLCKSNPIVHSRIYWDVRICVVCGMIQVKDRRAVGLLDTWEKRGVGKISGRDIDFHRRLTMLTKSLRKGYCEGEIEERDDR